MGTLGWPLGGDINIEIRRESPGHRKREVKEGPGTRNSLSGR